MNIYEICQKIAWGCRLILAKWRSESQSSVVVDDFSLLLEEHFQIIFKKRALSIRPVFQLDISEFSTDFHLNQLFAYFTVGYG